MPEACLHLVLMALTLAYVRSPGARRLWAVAVAVRGVAQARKVASIDDFMTDPPASGFRMGSFRDVRSPGDDLLADDLPADGVNRWPQRRAWTT